MDIYVSDCLDLQPSLCGRHLSLMTSLVQVSLDPEAAQTKAAHHTALVQIFGLFVTICTDIRMTCVQYMCITFSGCCSDALSTNIFVIFANSLGTQLVSKVPSGVLRFET